jgi:hypothetical protein
MLGNSERCFGLRSSRIENRIGIAGRLKLFCAGTYLMVEMGEDCELSGHG